MNAVELMLPDGQPSGVWMCSACKQLATDRAWIDKHCICTDCGKPHDWKRNSVTCDSCRAERRRKVERDRMERAEKLDAWDGWVCVDGDRYFQCLDDYLDHLGCYGVEPEDWPEYVYVAEPEPFKGIDLERAIEHATDGWSWEDFDPDEAFSGMDELRAAVDVFNAANKGVVAYYANESKAVRVPKSAAVEEETQA